MAVMLFSQAAAAFASDISVAQTTDTPIVLTLGADLTEEQKQNILSYFGITEDQVKVVTITNADEREQLGNLLPEEQIGTHTLSCALIRLTTSGGVQVKAANLNYVNSQMISSTLATSGVYNCEVLTAAPFEVSGTGALTGIMMAYESATGQQLDQEKKELANEELVITGDLAQSVGQDQATLVVNDIKIHIVRDQITDESEISTVVDEVVDEVQTAAEKTAAVLGNDAPASLGEVEHQQLYSYGKKVSEQSYEYKDMQRTLERVTYGASQNSGIEDSIISTFETLDDEVELDPDSILLNTNDEVLGEDAIINATVKAALGEHEAEIIEVFTGDPTIEEAGKVKADEFIRGTNLVSYQDVNGSYALMDLNGNMLTDSIYEDYFRGSYGLITGELNDGSGAEGVFASNGTVLVPFEYADVEIVSENWAFGITLTATDNAEDYDYTSSANGYLIIEQVDVYYIEEDASTLAGSFSREQYSSADAYGEYLNIKDRSGVVTTYDRNLNALRTAEYTSDFGEYEDSSARIDLIKEATGYYVSSFYNGYARAYDGSTGLYGLVDAYGNTIIPLQYERIRLAYDNDSYQYVAGGYIGVETNGTFAFLTQGGIVTGSFTYPADQVENYGMTALYEGDDGSVILLSGDGVETDLSGYSYYRSISESDGMFWKCSTDEYASSYDLVDWHGNVLLSGCAGLSVSKNGNYLIAQDGYTSSALYLINGAAPVSISDTAGGATEVETAIEEGASLEAFTGDPVLEDTGYEVPAGTFLSGADLIAYGSDNATLALYDVTGMQLTDAVYSGFSYDEGWIVVQQTSGTDVRYGLVGTDGEPAVPCDYDYVDVLSECWALGYTVQAVSDSDEYDMYISGIGYCSIEEVDVCHLTDQTYVTITRDQFADADAYQDYINIKDRSTGNVTTYDGSFTAVSAANSVYDFRNYSADYVLVQKVEDATGYYLDDEFVDGYAIAWNSDTGLYGVVDMNGEEVLPLEYDRIRTTRWGGQDHVMTNGYFYVRKDGMDGYVTAGGEVTCELKYDDENVYGYSGMAFNYQEEDGTYTLVAADGTETRGYRSLYSLNDIAMFWIASTEEGRFLIDWHGNAVEGSASSVSMSDSGNYLLVVENYSDVTAKLYAVNGAEAEGTEAAGAAASEESAANTAKNEDGTAVEETEAAQESGQAEANETTEEPAAEEAVSSEDGASESADTDAAKALLESALTLASDPAANQASILTLLTQAKTMLGGSNTAAETLIDNIMSLVNSGEADAASVQTLLTSTISLL